MVTSDSLSGESPVGPVTPVAEAESQEQMTAEALEDFAKMSRAELEAKLLQLQNKLYEVSEAVRNPWHSARTKDGKYKVNIPLCVGNYPITINGKRYAGRMTLAPDVLAQVMEIYYRCNEVELQRMQFRGNMAPIELVPANDLISRITRNQTTNL